MALNAAITAALKACVKAICWTSLYIFLLSIPYFLSDTSASEKVIELASFYVTAFSVYISISVLGWLFIGLPTHWLIMKFTNAHMVWYCLAAALIFFILFLLDGRGVDSIALTLFWTLPIIVQIILFKLFVDKPESA